MARKSKNETTVTDEEVAPEVASAPVKEKKSKKEKKDKKEKKEKKEKKDKDKKSKKEKKDKKKSKAVEEPAEAVPESTPSDEVETEPVAEDAAPTEEAPTVVAQLQTSTDEAVTAALEAASSHASAMKNLVSTLRALQRALTKERRETSKVLVKAVKTSSKRKRKKGGNPGGFNKPVPLSEPLCDFLGVDHGTEKPRTEVTRALVAYIKEKELQNPEERKQVLPDAKLKSLLNCGDDDKVTFFNLQSYMKYHFLKRDPETNEVLPYSPATSS